MRLTPDHCPHFDWDKSEAGVWSCKDCGEVATDAPWARCVICNTSVSQVESLDRKLDRCPNCGSKGVPCSPDKDVSVNINWHELRILTIWASNYAAECDEKDPASDCRKVVAAIGRRLRAQHPTMAPLTLAGEIAEVREAFGAENVKTNIPEDAPVPPSRDQVDGDQPESAGG